MKKLPLLGGLTPGEFMQEYWHKKPLLIRQAIPELVSPASRDVLLDLARRDDVESRLISRAGKKNWQVTSGPFDSIDTSRRDPWTLLVQGANYHLAEADSLLQQFRFLPYARFDDLMISYAVDGGGVGPHFDSYDVFLLQAHGQRRWRISAQKDLSLVEGVPLKILKNFSPDEEYVLEPGDMLYLPPHYAHDGVAIGECVTCSIGFRAPSWQELGENFMRFMEESVDLPGRYADPDLTPTTRPAEIQKIMLERIASEINKIKFTADDIRIFAGETLSEPNTTVFFTPPAKPVTRNRFFANTKQTGLALSPKSRMLYSDNLVFINGESFEMTKDDKGLLKQFADQRKVDGSQITGASADVRDALYQWYCDGWVEVC